MFLCVPAEYVPNVVVGEWVCFVACAIRTRVRTESLLPVFAIVEPVRVVESVTCFMSHEAHRFGVGFDALGEVVFDALEPGVGEVEGNADEGSSIGAAPLVAEVYGWSEAHAFGRELLVELIDHAFDAGAGDREAKL